MKGLILLGKGHFIQVKPGSHPEYPRNWETMYLRPAILHPFQVTGKLNNLRYSAFLRFRRTRHGGSRWKSKLVMSHATTCIKWAQEKCAASLIIFPIPPHPHQTTMVFKVAGNCDQMWFCRCSLTVPLSRHFSRCLRAQRNWDRWGLLLMPLQTLVMRLRHILSMKCQDWFTCGRRWNVWSRRPMLYQYQFST